MKIISSFSNRIKEYRESHLYTLEDMARLTGLPAQTIWRYETNARTPKYDTAVDIAHHLHVNPLWILGYDVDIVNKDDSSAPPIPGFDELTDENKKVVQDYIDFLLSKQ
jgi:transcriptional regulator with XRE-family HTH domain